jgi:Tfp pilus assembly protein PilF
MRTRSTSFIAAIALLSVVPLAARSQTDASLKLSTANPAAATEFRAGMTDAQGASFESAHAHFKAAIDADPNFGLARVLYASSFSLPRTANKHWATPTRPMRSSALRHS